MQQRKIIDNTGECSVQMFMDCCFANKYRVLLIEGEATDDELKAFFEDIYAQWVDGSGLYQSTEFDKYGYIHTLEVRKFVLEQFIVTQKEFISKFGLPYIPGFEIAKKYGHRLYFNPESPDVELFIKKLDTIYSKESRYRAELIKKKDELHELRQKKMKNEYTPLQSRRQFISMITNLQKNGYHIERRATMMEDVEVMLKDTRDAIEERNAKEQFKNFR